MKNVQINEVATLAQIVYAFGQETADMITENGIWEIAIGSRGMVDFVEKNDLYKEESDLIDGETDEEELEYLKEHIEEYYSIEGMIDYCGCPGFGVAYYEEASSLFVNVQEL